MTLLHVLKTVSTVTWISALYIIYIIEYNFFIVFFGRIISKRQCLNYKFIKTIRCMSVDYHNFLNRPSIKNTKPLD